MNQHFSNATANCLGSASLLTPRGLCAVKIQTEQLLELSEPQDSPGEGSPGLRHTMFYFKIIKVQTVQHRFTQSKVTHPDWLPVFPLLRATDGHLKPLLQAEKWYTTWWSIIRDFFQYKPEVKLIQMFPTSLSSCSEVFLALAFSRHLSPYTV